MASTVNDVLTPDPLTIDVSQTVRSAAELMRGADTGSLVVTDGNQVVGLVTDRDLVVRVLATGGGADDEVREACSTQLVTVAPTDDIADAARLMAEYAVRRLPVVAGSELVGIVSIGDLAVERDPDSALGGISAKEPNV